MFSGVGLAAEARGTGGGQRVRGRARRGRAGVREHAGGIPGLPKSVSGRSVGGNGSACGDIESLD